MPESTVPQIVAERIAWATRYVKFGWKVFVLGMDKTPLPNCADCPNTDWKHDRERCSCLVCHGFYAATDSIDRYAEMIERHPFGWLAVRTGQTSQLIVLDFDNKPDEDGHTGLNTLDEFESWSNGVELPATLRQRTQSGGLHLLYRPTPGVFVTSRNRVLPQMDIKGEGGYVAVPTPGKPERHWISHPQVAPVSNELLAWIMTARGTGWRDGGEGSSVRPTGYDYHAYLRDGCPGGARDEFFNELLFRLRKAGQSQDGAWAVARAHWNACAQPDKPGFTAEWFMPWEHVEYKLERIWQTVAPPEPMPAWRPTENVIGQTEQGETIVKQGNVAIVRGDW